MASILVIDDEAPIRRVLRLALEIRGHEVAEAANGRKAIEAMESSAFDVVITDIIMPEADGIEVARFLRRHRPEVKVIAISAASTPLFLESIHGLGAERTFGKPLVLAEVADAVEELLTGTD